MKIGFFGGSFNPPTNAHIDLAKKALDIGKLDKVVFIPMGNSYEKIGLANAKDRYNMLKIACDNINNIEVSDLEIKINKKLYAIDAFRLIEREYIEDDVYFLMGADNFINILNWKDGKELISGYNYIVFERSKIDLEKYINEHEEVKKYVSNIKIIKNNEFRSISSTEFRKLLNCKKNISHGMIPKEVMNYIIENAIY